MNILLIGKFPPCQGGVATKFYWLFSAFLTRRDDFKFYAITIAKKPYVTSLPNHISSRVRVIISENPDIPWFIPKSDLFVDQIVNLALQLAIHTQFDIIICNYLEPYLAATYIVSQLLSIPYLVFPAGSDMKKLLPCPNVSVALVAYLQQATKICLPQEKITNFKELYPTISPKKILPVNRYVPDSYAFTNSTARTNNTILFCGKVNRYWRLRGISKLCDLLNKFLDIKLKCYIQGAYLREFKSEILKYVSSSQVNIVEKFISPECMPIELSSAFAVWNYLEEGGIVDFPNIHWETLYSGCVSICSDFLLRQPDTEKTLYPFTKLIVNADSKDWQAHLRLANNRLDDNHDLKELKERTYEQYLEQHYLLFTGVLNDN